MDITYKHEIKFDQKTSKQDIVDLLLKNRNIKEIKAFLNPPHPTSLTLKDFGFEKEAKKTINILKKIKEKNEMIVVYTDYDADGITGGAIVWETLYLLGFKVMPYVPHRKLEGYGFSKKGIDNVKKEFNPALIISVDHGISAAEKIEYARSIGIPVIITDHHVKPEKLPKAEVIIHIPQLSGSSVAYFFAKEIFNHFGDKHSSNFQLQTSNFSTDYLSLASIGTVADLVPLIGPSRGVVKHGLEAFSKVKRVGITHIFKEAKIEGKKITPYEIGFIIAPRINAIGRLSHAIDALRLLCTKSDKRAHDLAHQIGKTNEARQGLVEGAVKEAMEMVETPVPKLIILVSPDSPTGGWHEGIIGLIASKIMEKYYRPVIVLTRSDGFYKASARSIASFHMTNFLRSLKKYLIDVGGHKQAAGFTIEKEQLPAFIKKAQKEAQKLIKKKDLERKIEADIKIPLSLINLSLTLQLETFEPFGIGNSRPVFVSEVEILDAKLFGKKNDHLKITVKDANKSSFPVDMIGFSMSKELTKLSRGQKIQVVYSIEVDRWNGREKVRGRIINLT